MFRLQQWNRRVGRTTQLQNLPYCRVSYAKVVWLKTVETRHKTVLTPPRYAIYPRPDSRPAPLFTPHKCYDMVSAVAIGQVGKGDKADKLSTWELNEAPLSTSSS